MNLVAVLTTNISEKVLEFMNTFFVKPNDKTFEAYFDALILPSRAKSIWFGKLSYWNLFLRFAKVASRKRVAPMNQGYVLSLLREEYSKSSNHSQLGLKLLVKEAFYFHWNTELRTNILKRGKQGYCSSNCETRWQFPIEITAY